ncbi:unnamed protein product [Citrullus colocynthis]|uniref:Uncharacterized protein n=1 Tax=Citrullus colocynthis TaxID=252529 RepID=A0ABP0Y421_9ROSI
MIDNNAFDPGAQLLPHRSLWHRSYVHHNYLACYKHCGEFLGLVMIIQILVPLFSLPPFSSFSRATSPKEFAVQVLAQQVSKNLVLQLLCDSSWRTPDISLCRLPLTDPAPPPSPAPRLTLSRTHSHSLSLNRSHLPHASIPADDRFPHVSIPTGDLESEIYWDWTATFVS